jgi:CRP/FNR family cyclic AMP-dependent transcriptional regulator
VTVTLDKIPILAGLDEAALDLLRQGTMESKVEAGSVIVREGETGNRLFLIAEGSVRVCKHFGEPNEFELARFYPGDFVGEMCILETLPRCATVQAVTDSMLYSVSSMTFHHLYQDMPRQYSILVLNIARDLSRRLRHVDELFAARH